MPFSATAAGNVSGGTCSLTEDCHAGPNTAMPLPTIKQNASRICGVTRPSHASTDSAVAPASAIPSETSATMRRSYMSAMAPAGIEISMIGSIRAVWTSATLSADDVICVSEVDAFLTQVGGENIEALRREHEFDALRDGRVVLDQQDPH